MLVLAFLVLLVKTFVYDVASAGAVGSGKSNLMGSSGTLNLNQIGIIDAKATKAVIMKGKRGLKRSHSWAPIYGAGREIKPKLLRNMPVNTPNSFCGTTLEINDW